MQRAGCTPQPESAYGRWWRAWGVRVRGSVLAVLAVVVTASPAVGLVVEVVAPAVAPTDGTPFEARVEVRGLEGPGELKVWLGGEAWQASRTWDGQGWLRSDWYVVPIQPGAQGGWSGWVAVRANPGSTHHERLLASQDALLGARVRVDGARAEGQARVELVDEPWRVPVTLAPGEHVEARQAGALVARRGHPGEAPRVVEVALPQGFAGTLCVAAVCEPAHGLRLAAAGTELAVVENAGDQPAPLAGAVLAFPEGRCPLSGALDVGARMVVSLEAAPAGSGLAPGQACTPEGPSSQEVALSQVGRRVDAVAPPAWGWRVRDGAGGGTLVPWPLPVGTWPAPLEPLEVDGWAHPVETANGGLEAVLQVIDGAQHRLTVSTYLFTNEQVAQALARAAGRGVAVTLYLEPSPIGGLPADEARLVSRLEAAGVSVVWAQGPWSARGVQHAKVLVADGAVVLVLTENLTHSGLPEPGRAGNVGWGLGVANTSLARAVEAWFQPPGPPVPWVPDGWTPFHGTVTVLAAPENAWRPEGVPAALEASHGPVAGLVLTASTRWGPASNPWLDALVNASHRGPVRVLFNGAGFEGRVDRSTLAAASYLRAHPSAGDLQVRLSDPGAPRVHAKGLVGPGWAYVGSSNWGAGGALLNREVGLLVQEPATAAFFQEAFETIWRGGEDGGGDARPVPGAPMVCVVVALALRALGERRGRRVPGSR